MAGGLVTINPLPQPGPADVDAPSLADSSIELEGIHDAGGSTGVGEAAEHGILQDGGPSIDGAPKSPTGQSGTAGHATSSRAGATGPPLSRSSVHCRNCWIQGLAP